MFPRFPAYYFHLFFMIRIYIPILIPKKPIHLFPEHILQVSWKHDLQIVASHVQTCIFGNLIFPEPYRSWQGQFLVLDDTVFSRNRSKKSNSFRRFLTMRTISINEVFQMSQWGGQIRSALFLLILCLLALQKKRTSIQKK